MIPVLARAQMRAFDAHAIDACQVPGLLLMENAGRGAADVIASELRRLRRSGPILILCGAGNNGGDGFVIARHLHSRGFVVRAILVVKVARLEGDALGNYRSFMGVGGHVVEVAEHPPREVEQSLTGAGALVDAVFGTGLDREITGFLRSVVELASRLDCPRFAVDLPSGIDADTGAVHGVALSAQHTVTFAHPKLGLSTPTGMAHAGQVHVVDIGVPGADQAGLDYPAEIVEERDVRAAISARPPNTHKASAGRVLVVAGSKGKIGAALLCARGAIRAGAGLVTIAALPETADLLDQRVLEIMTARLDPEKIEASIDALLDRADAIALGPGIGLDATARRIVDHVTLGCDKPRVIDADAITHFAGRAEALRAAPAQFALTPHSGEMARLLGVSAKDVEADRFGAVQRGVESCGGVLLLKGQRTLVGAPGQRMTINTTGSSVLATGGSGDVLSGVLAAFGTLVDIRRAAYSAAYVHGMAGERLARRGVDRGVLAHEVADEVPHALGAIHGSSPSL